MPVVKPTGQRGPMVTGSGQNGLDLENLHRQYLHNDYYDYY